MNKKNLFSWRNTAKIADWQSWRWQAYADKAQQIVSANGKLARDYWAAWIADLTGIYCHRCGFSAPGIPSGEAYMGERPEFFDVTEIADSDNIWFQTLGKDAMLRAILFLEHETYREAALDAAGGCFSREKRDYLPVVRRVAGQLSMQGMPEPGIRCGGNETKRPNRQVEPFAARPMTEPQEVFAAVMTGLRVVAGGQATDLSSEGLVESFYET